MFALENRESNIGGKEWQGQKRVAVVNLGENKNIDENLRGYVG